ncbi:hypothetical protein T05_3133 [Trichinella murrelli]|uniref:Uncharacterized protein n=1 Tax=Trichinella murrelli TaxID=144512 RepID=A0A0V0U2C8_9BILA|nr:hypothetical protein T05_3133 [Trichinella murrelli]
MHRNSTNKRTKDREIGQLRLPAWDRTGGRAPHLLFRYLWIFNQDPLLTNVDKLPSMTTHIRTPKWLLCPNALPFAKLANQKCYRRICKLYHENTTSTKTFVLFVITYQYFFLFVKNPGQHSRRFRMAFYLSIARLCDSEEYATRKSIEQLYKD